MRYFLKLAYNGTRFCGWQRQPNGPSVQEELEKALELLLQEKIETLGCGRTDAGVHATKYYLHFDTEQVLPVQFIARINKIVGRDIAVYSTHQVPAEAHARFDATKRAYQYHICSRKDPFSQETKYFLHHANTLNRELMQQTAALFLEYQSFFPFCKTGSDNLSVNCQLFESRWDFRDDEYLLTYHVSANRFLRGMVRLLVGACLSAGSGLLTVQEIKIALDQQIRLKKSQSVPPQGLYLSDIIYPYL
jgi:tRNA pseudouridine38-40 synthase